MDRSAVILAGGFSRRFGQDKGLTRLVNKPLVKYVFDAINSIVDEEILVVSSKKQADNYRQILGSEIKIKVDVTNVQSPLVGALTGLGEAKGTYSLLLSCDTPFLDRNALLLLFELSPNKNAVIPRWPNGYIEPLQAVYCTKLALEAAKKALEGESLNLQSMIDRLGNVRYVSTLVLQQIDPELKTFFNINTLLDLKKAELLMKERKAE